MHAQCVKRGLLNVCQGETGAFCCVFGGAKPPKVGYSFLSKRLCSLMAPYSDKFVRHGGFRLDADGLSPC